MPAGSGDHHVADVPPPLDDDEDVVDAEIVEVADAGMIGSSPAGSIATDYSDSGVPSLDYLRDRIEGRYATAAGSAELAEAAAARETALRAAAEQRAALDAEQQRETRERAATQRLDEIRRSLHPEACGSGVSGRRRRRCQWQAPSGPAAPTVIHQLHW